MSNMVKTFLSLLWIPAVLIFVNGSFLAATVGAEETLEDLVALEKKIQSSVERVMPAVVAVTDRQGYGSGVIVSSDGLVLTAGHVMASPYKKGYEVIFPDGRVAKAEALGKNLNVDAGMLKIVDPGPYPFVELAELEPELGDWVITMGHSGGYDLARKPPVRTGRLLGRRDHQLITDAVLIGGDSGGPLFDIEGKVIGIHSSIGDSIAENRHVRISTFRTHWTRMIAGNVWGELPDLSSRKKKSRNIKRAKMGVVVDREAVNALVKQVHPDSPAARAGIRTGDVITKFDGKLVENAADLIAQVKTKRPGTSHTVEILRGGYYFKVELVLDQF